MPCCQCFTNPQCFMEIATLTEHNLTNFSYIKSSKNIYHVCIYQQDTCNKFVLYHTEDTDIVTLKEMAEMVEKKTNYRHGTYVSNLCSEILSTSYVLKNKLFIKVNLSTGHLVLPECLNGWWGRSYLRILACGCPFKSCCKILLMYCLSLWCFFF